MPDYFVYRAGGDDEATTPEDDPYAEFKVPDDLMW